jgi:hypothetical protein
LPVLHAVQRRLGHIPPDALPLIAQGAQPVPGRSSWRADLLSLVPDLHRRAGPSCICAGPRPARRWAPPVSRRTPGKRSVSIFMARRRTARSRSNPSTALATARSVPRCWWVSGCMAA